MRTSRRRQRVLRAVLGLAIILALGFAADAIVLVTTHAHADAADMPDAVANHPRSPSTSAGAISGDSPRSSLAKPEAPSDEPRTSRAMLFRRWPTAVAQGTSDSWSLTMIGITVTLAIFGGLVAASRRFLPQQAGVAMQVVGRVSLSPRHTVYMLRVGTGFCSSGPGPRARRR